MDPHFDEYLAAVAGMHDIYGDRPDDHPTDFQHQGGGMHPIPVPAMVAG